MVHEKDGKYFFALTEQKQGTIGILELEPTPLQWELLEPQCDQDVRSVHL